MAVASISGTDKSFLHYPTDLSPVWSGFSICRADLNNCFEKNGPFFHFSKHWQGLLFFSLLIAPRDPPSLCLNPALEGVWVCTPRDTWLLPWGRDTETQHHKPLSCVNTHRNLHRPLTLYVSQFPLPLDLDPERNKGAHQSRGHSDPTPQITSLCHAHEP